MKLSKKQHLIYDIVISTLAIMAVALIVIDFSEGLNSWEVWADRLILSVFVVDYLVRFPFKAFKAAQTVRFSLPPLKEGKDIF